ncbi:hypothetical protein pah_c200o130 [Parachlamydia acanthamoebae str. Hall's coccus]|nr:hypothetical protein pah_c200o130 [Parachlamydia acanthamoebae str. Hall's coccus]
MFLARLCLAAIFIIAGIGKILDYDSTLAYMVSKGIPMAPFFLVLAALLEVLAGICLVIGYKTRLAAALLMLFLIPTTGIFHNFWDVAEPAARQLQMTMFLKNLGIFGGLWYVLCCGSGRYGCDAVCCSRTPDSKIDS